jgi:hypothetical protein
MKDWDDWIEVIRTTALSANVWENIDPNKPKTNIPTLTLPTRPEPSYINLQLPTRPLQRIPSFLQTKESSFDSFKLTTTMTARNTTGNARL